MEFDYQDFNNAAAVFHEQEGGRWDELEHVLGMLPLFLQPSDQAQRLGEPIFDPKATNAFLTAAATGAGWRKIPVPIELTMFGKDWDAGKGRVLAEWQFSNYPFLWNNVIRSEAVFKGDVALEGMDGTTALAIVTKSGALPASNSTLYYEQACAQLAAVTSYETFEIPIRVVGLKLPDANEVDAIWTTYPSRYARQGGQAVERRFGVTLGPASQYGVQPYRLTPQAV